MLTLKQIFLPRAKAHKSKGLLYTQMKLSIIVCFTHKTFGIRKSEQHVSNDLTEGERNVCVMDYETYQSMTTASLPTCTCIVIKNPHEGSSRELMDNLHPDDVMIVSIESFERWRIRNRDTLGTISIIGGTLLYRDYMNVADTIYATIIEKEYDCDEHYPTEKFHRYSIDSYSDRLYSEHEGCHYRRVVYKRNSYDVLHHEFRYLSLLDAIVFSGTELRPDRTSVGTLAQFGKQLRFDISKSIPLITTKFVPWKLVVKELLWFMQGKTDSKILERQGVNIWKDNSSRGFLDARGLTHYREGDIGPMYGFNWRHYNADYKGCDADYTGMGYDQLQHLIDGLRNDPYSRRHMITTFNPCALKDSVLAPCHGIVVQFFVEQIDAKKHLSCHMYQRSCDSALGLVINIASYAIFTHVIAKMCDMLPNELIISTGDTHVYQTHMKQVTEQIMRSPLPFPVLELSDDICTKSVDEITLDDFQVIGYLHHPAIQFPMAV